MFRLLGLLGALSVMTDLGTGSATDESLRRCLVATRFARSLQCSDEEVATVMYAALLEHLGCTAYAHESARIWGDDIAPTRYAFLSDMTRPGDLLRTFVPGVAAATGTSRLRVAGTIARHGRRMDAEAPAATCEVARDAARELGLGPGVAAALHAALASWDGRGHPSLAGDAIPLPSRILHVAALATLVHLHAGPQAARRQLAARAGRGLDPELVARFTPDLLDGLDETGSDPWQSALDAEPEPVRRVGDEQLLDVARTFGHLADLKSPWLHGHSAAVGSLAGDAAGGLAGLDRDTVRAVRIAGHLHDIGRVAVSSAVWDKAGPLTRSEREAVELHPWWTEKILARVPELADVAVLAGRHHERCDGSGYHRGLGAAQLTPGALVLAAADRYRCLVEGRPHRAASSPAEAAAALAVDVRAGRLDGDAVAAVCESAGHRAAARSSRPAGLTQRQVEVLRLVAAGLSNGEVAARLVISRRTAEHHVQDIYVRIGVSTRAGAALFAMEHGLLGNLGRSADA